MFKTNVFQDTSEYGHALQSTTPVGCNGDFGNNSRVQMHHFWREQSLVGEDNMVDAQDTLTPLIIQMYLSDTLPDIIPVTTL